MPDAYHSHTCSDRKEFHFVWDKAKDEANQDKHDIGFTEAAKAFCDPGRLFIYDQKHSSRSEKRFFLLGKVEAGRVLTVRFTRRDKYIRIIGAGFWRDGQTRYDNR